MKPKILLACEFSGIVRSAFQDVGWDAWSCDLLPSDIKGQHIQGDVLDVIEDHWDAMIAFPPCTFLCNSGVRWLHSDRSRWKLMQKACDFFNSLKNAPIEKICIENPIPHKYARDLVGDYSQKVHPWWFGVQNESKSTCLWLKNLPKLEKFKPFDPPHYPRVHRESPGEDRWKRRSITDQGMAYQMARQWGV